MVFGGTRFTRSGHRARPGATPRVIDVEVRLPHKTLYEVLVVPPTTSSRQIRRIARALRRNLPNTSDLHDVCLAEQVLGRPELRARYDALLARVRAAKQAMPEIGAAIEASRLGPSFSARITSAGRAGTTAAGRAFKLVLQIGFAILLIVLAAAGLGAIGSGHRSGRYTPISIPEYHIPKFDPKAFEIPKIEIPKFDPKVFEIPKIEIPKIQIPKIDIEPLETPAVERRMRERKPLVTPKRDLPRRELRKQGLPQPELPRFVRPELDPDAIELEKAPSPSYPSTSPTTEPAPSASP